MGFHKVLVADSLLDLPLDFLHPLPAMFPCMDSELGFSNAWGRRIVSTDYHVSIVDKCRHDMYACVISKSTRQTDGLPLL